MVWLFSLLFGASFGSFANVCIVRLPTDESIAGPNSHCMQCGHPLRIQDNIPFLSYLLLRGRCHFCRKKISIRYPLIEGAVVMLFLLNAWWFSQHLFMMVLADLLAFYSITISVIDYDHRIIPDELSLSLLVLGLALSWWNPLMASEPGWTRLGASVASTLVGGGGMLAIAWLGEKLFKKEAMGGGDIKLVAAFGALLGWLGIWSALLFGSLMGAGIGLFLMLVNKKKRSDTLPFGPYLCLGALLMVYIPKSLFFYVLPIFH